MNALPSPISRPVWVSVALAWIVAGLVVNRAGLGLPPTARDVAGDALWAMMVFAGIGVLLPTRSIRARAAIAIAIAWAVEFSQLYHTATLDAWRQTTAGRLVLGVGFDARDLAAYAAGVLAGIGLELVMRGRRDQ